MEHYPVKLGIMKIEATERPLVSILMTSYNRENDIGAAIESVLASTYENFELIVVDDRSTDRSVEVAESYASQDSRIYVHLNDHNLGDYPNRNQAASLAQGKYLKYVDCDDLIYPHGLEILVEYMEQFPEAGYGLCSLEQDRYRIFPFQLSPVEAYRRHYFDQSLFHKAPLSCIIRKEAFESVGGFTGKKYLGDFEMWHILSTKYPVVLMPHGIVWYRDDDRGEMGVMRANIAYQFRYFLLAVEYLKSPENPLSKNERQTAIDNMLRIQARFILRTVKEFGIRRALELQQMSTLSPIEVVARAFSARKGI